MSIIEFFKTSVLLWQIISLILLVILGALMIIFFIMSAKQRNAYLKIKEDFDSYKEESDDEKIKIKSDSQELSNKCSDLTVRNDELTKELVAKTDALQKAEAKLIMVSSDLSSAEKTVAVLNLRIEESEKNKLSKPKETIKKVRKPKVEKADVESIKESTTKLETLVKDLFDREDYSIENLSKMTKDSLIKIAKDHKLEGYTALKKEDLIKFVNEKLGKKVK